MSTIERRIAALETPLGSVDQDREQFIREVQDGNPEALAQAAQESGVAPEAIQDQLRVIIIEAMGPPIPGSISLR